MNLWNEIKNRDERWKETFTRGNILQIITMTITMKNWNDLIRKTKTVLLQLISLLARHRICCCWHYLYPLKQPLVLYSHLSLTKRNTCPGNMCTGQQTTSSWGKAWKEFWTNWKTRNANRKVSEEKFQWKHKKKLEGSDLQSRTENVANHQSSNCHAHKSHLLFKWI